ncbi:4-hydroxybenzoate octaprenyltransferase [Fontivita pretiosa]|uniref:4-hydroxybenzoate octaprenyltransferase n=1 Tax=Fontivita pretiosa TaxID=2989684 RepID=UPI003D172613
MNDQVISYGSQGPGQSEARVASAVCPGPAALHCSFVVFARDIKVSHTVFAMPWALLATFLAAGGAPRLGQLLLIVLCMVTARTVAMSSNRLLDAELDARNPRTAGRAIPSGRLSRMFYIAALGVCGLAFVVLTSLFWLVYGNVLPLALSLPVLLFVGAYPLLKRFTKLCHYYLGAALALAPVCAWVAIAPKMDLTPFLMAAAVLLWTAGFDIIYACQDYHSDLQTGVVSVPARIGIGPALWVARLTHAGSFVAMLLLGLHEPQLGLLYLIGVGCAGGLLILEHAIVSPDDLSRVGLAFFTFNGIISLLVGALGVIDVFV